MISTSLAHTFLDLYELQRACEVEIAAQAGGQAALNLPRPESALRSASQHAAAVKSDVDPTLVFGAMRRMPRDQACCTSY
jgi:hypothetical protein